MKRRTKIVLELLVLGIICLNLTGVTQLQAELPSIPDGNEPTMPQGTGYTRASFLQDPTQVYTQLLNYIKENKDAFLKQLSEFTGIKDEKRLEEIYAAIIALLENPPALRPLDFQQIP